MVYPLGMAFEPKDFDALIQYLDENPDVKDQLRRRILSEDFLRLPMMVIDLQESLKEVAEVVVRIGQVVADLAQAQSATTQIVRDLVRTQAATAEVVRELAQSQARTEQRMDELAQAQARTERRIDELAQAQARTEQRIDELAQAQARTEQRIDELAQRVHELTQELAVVGQMVRDLVQAQMRTELRIGELGIRTSSAEGWMLEHRYRERASSYFGIYLRYPRRIEHDELEGVDEALVAGILSQREVDNLQWIDVLVQGKDKREPHLPETLLTVEVSVTIDADDVLRAEERARILTKAGYRAIGVVGGITIGESAQSLADRAGVLVRLTPATGLRSALASCP